MVSTSTNLFINQRMSEETIMLVDQRLSWHKEFEAGELNSSYLKEYKSIRLSESDRMGVGIERLCEYVIWLESKLQEKGYD